MEECQAKQCDGPIIRAFVELESTISDCVNSMKCLSSRLDIVTTPVESCDDACDGPKPADSEVANKLNSYTDMLKQLDALIQDTERRLEF